MTEPRYFVAVQHVRSEIDIAAIIVDLRGDELEMNL
jgi:hypothetical protein